MLGFSGLPTALLEPPRRAPLLLTILRWFATLLRILWRVESESWPS